MKTIVGSFDSFDEANQVARELMDDGFRDSDVSVVASNIRDDYRSGTGTSSGAAIDAPADTSTGVAGTGSMLGPRGTRTSTGFTNDTGAGTMPGVDTAGTLGAGTGTTTTTGEHYTRSAADNAITEDGAGLTDAILPLGITDVGFCRDFLMIPEFCLVHCGSKLPAGLQFTESERA